MDYECTCNAPVTQSLVVSKPGGIKAWLLQLLRQIRSLYFYPTICRDRFLREHCLQPMVGTMEHRDWLG